MCGREGILVVADVAGGGEEVGVIRLGVVVERRAGAVVVRIGHDDAVDL